MQLQLAFLTLSEANSFLRPINLFLFDILYEICCRPLWTIFYIFYLSEGIVCQKMNKNLFNLGLLLNLFIDN